MTRRDIKYPSRFGPYALLRPLGDPHAPYPVFLAGLAGSDKAWAIKVVGKGTTEPSFEAIKAEAKILARITNPHLVNVLDATTVEGDSVLVMGFVAGRTLGEIAQHLKALGARAPADLSAIVAHDLAHAALALHDFEGAGLGHGNISNHTVMVSPRGEIRLVGYRPARSPGQSPGRSLEGDLRSIARVVRQLRAATSIPILPESAAEVDNLTAFCDPQADGAALTAIARALARQPVDRERLAAFFRETFGRALDQEKVETESLLAHTESVLAIAPARRSFDDYPKPGAKVGGYRISRAIGEGGMGRVLEAVDELSGKKVAIKVLHPSRRTPAMEERFRREATAVARIVNPHVVTIEKFGETDDGKLLFLAMELLDGRTLDRVIHEEGPLEIARAQRISLQIADGVAAAHKAGVVHRDLKPANIMVVGKGDAERAKILDFGLARVETPQGLALTRAGDLVGTFAYAAPEQALGRPAAPSFDIYALGELFYEMLTQKLPHEAQEAHDLLKKKATEEPTPLWHHRPDLAGPVDAVVMRALARLPRDRFSSAREFAEALQGLGPRPNPAPAGSSGKRARLSRVALGAPLAVGATVAAFLVARAFSSGPSTGQAGPGVAHGPALPAALPKLAPVSPLPSPSPPTQVTPAIEAPSDRPPPPSKLTASRIPSKPPTARVLKQAEMAFELGNTIEAIQLASDALENGAGNSAHLALGKYYMKMRLNQKAMQHYKAVLVADPENDIASAALVELERLSVGK